MLATPWSLKLWSLKKKSTAVILYTHFTNRNMPILLKVPSFTVKLSNEVITLGCNLTRIFASEGQITKKQKQKNIDSSSFVHISMDIQLMLPATQFRHLQYLLTSKLWLTHYGFTVLIIYLCYPHHLKFDISELITS